MKQTINLDQNLRDGVTQMKAQQPTTAAYQKMQHNLQNAIQDYDAAINEPVTLIDRLKDFFLTFSLSKILTPPSLAISTTTLTVALVATFVILLSGTQPTFAKVVEHFSHFKTLTYTSQFSSQNAPLMSLKVFYQAPAFIRVETAPDTGNSENHQNGKTVNILNAATGSGLLLFPSVKMAVPYSFDPTKEKSIQDDPLKWLGLVQNYQGDVTELPEKIIDGEVVHGYQFKEAGMTITIWATTDSQLPIKLELTSNQGKQNFQMQAKLAFDEPLDGSLFSLTIPNDYQQAEPDQE